MVFSEPHKFKINPRAEYIEAIKPVLHSLKIEREQIKELEKIKKGVEEVKYRASLQNFMHKKRKERLANIGYNSLQNSKMAKYA